MGHKWTTECAFLRFLFLFCPVLPFPVRSWTTLELHVQLLTAQDGDIYWWVGGRHFIHPRSDCRAPSLIRILSVFLTSFHTISFNEVWCQPIGHAHWSVLPSLSLRSHYSLSPRNCLHSTTIQMLLCSVQTSVQTNCVKNSNNNHWQRHLFLMTLNSGETLDLDLISFPELGQQVKVTCHVLRLNPLEYKQ